MSKNPKIDKICLYCEHASTNEAEISCPYKKSIFPDCHCFRFRYDPLKRTPHPKRPLPTLDPSCIID